MISFTHGTTTAYRNGCRCDECRTANTAANRAYKARGIPADDPRHGTYNAYGNFGCRCDPCKAAGAATRDPATSKAYKLLRGFGLTWEAYVTMWEAQGRACAVCRATLTIDPSAKEAVVDHDRSCCADNRSCGKCVRAILCQRCNVGLGMFQDNPERMRQAAAYIESHV